MKKLYVLLFAFWLIGIIVFPGSPKLKSPVNDANINPVNIAYHLLFPERSGQHQLLQKMEQACQAFGNNIILPCLGDVYSMFWVF